MKNEELEPAIFGNIETMIITHSFIIKILRIYLIYQ